MPLRANHGGIAQLGEHLPCKQGVVGSSPISSTIFGSLTIEESEISACGTPDEGVLQTQIVIDVKMTIAV